MKPTKCPDCAFPVKIVSARSWPDGHWEVGVVCSDRACRGFSVYDANGRLLGHPSLSPINPLHADIIRVLDGKRGSGASPKIGDVLAIQDRNRPAGENGEARPNPVICWKCREFMWIVGAHDFRRSWEVALLCSNSGCDGWGIYSSKRNLATSRTHSPPSTHSCRSQRSRSRSSGKGTFDGKSVERSGRCVLDTAFYGWMGWSRRLC